MPKDDWKYIRHDRNEALKRLHWILASSGMVTQSSHFRKRAIERDFNLLDAFNTLKQGKIHREPELDSRSDAWRYVIETRKMRTVFEFNEEGTGVLLVTCFWILEGRKL